MRHYTYISMHAETPTEPEVRVTCYDAHGLAPDLKIGEVTYAFDSQPDPIESMIALGQRIIDAAVQARAMMTPDLTPDPFMPVKAPAVAQDATITPDSTLAMQPAPSLAGDAGGDVLAILEEVDSRHVRVSSECRISELHEERESWAKANWEGNANGSKLWAAEFPEKDAELSRLISDIF